MIAYNGPFDKVYRQKMEKDLLFMVRDRKIETSDHFDILNSLSDANEIREWMLHGLPSDSNSH